MLLPTRVTNRRQFLERTALGAGSVLFLPGLLFSCADHRIPDPNAPGTPGVTPPLIVGDSSYNYNDAAKTIVIGGLRMIPEVGGLLSALTSILWPNTSVWSQVEDQVEALVEKKLDDTVSSLVEATLDDLRTAIYTYIQDLKDNSSNMASNWNTAQNTFNTNRHIFSLSGYEVLLLPFYAQFANMHLSLQRDVVVAGKSWGKNEAEQATDIKNLHDYIDQHFQYVHTTVQNYQNYLSNNVRADNELIQPFRAVNRFTREITLTVLDYATTWPYYEVTKYPNGANISFPRELYSDPSGSLAYNRDIPIKLPYVYAPPSASPTMLTVWGYTDGVNAVQLSYPEGSGPNFVTTTPRMGRQDVAGYHGSGTSDQPYGRILPISANNPIVQARTSITEDDSVFGTGVYAMELKLKDGTIINKVGGDDTQIWGPWLGIPDHFLSSIYIHGALGPTADNTWIADCIIFGFEYLTGGPTVTSSTLEHLYVTNPRELSGADLAQASPTNGAAAAVITENLKAARQTYWAANKARANAPK